MVEGAALDVGAYGSGARIAVLNSACRRDDVVVLGHDILWRIRRVVDVWHVVFVRLLVEARGGSKAAHHMIALRHGSAQTS